MKVKTMKILVLVATILFMVSMLATPVLAAVDAGEIIGGMEDNGGDVDTSDILSLGGNILNVLQVVGVVVGTIILVVLGLKYMAGSLEEKAEYKKTMIPYIVGAIIIFVGPSIAKGIFTMVSNLG